MLVTLGRVITGSRSSDILGISDRCKIIDFIERAIELGINEAAWQINIGTIDICGNEKGIITLPPFVGTVLATNVGGRPTWFRNSWYEFHINGLGDRGKCGQGCGYGYFTDDLLWTPTIQDLTQWSCVAAVCEDAVDGAQNPPLQLIVQGETMDANGNPKMAITIPAVGPSSPGVRVPLLNNYAPTDPAVTMFKRITQVTKPVTRGYVKLLGFPPNQNGQAVTLGYYGPNETNPQYRRIRVDAKCQWARVKYSRAQMPYTDDYEVLPIASYQAMLELVKVVRLRDANQGDEADKTLLRVIDLLTKIQIQQEGSSISPIQFDPSAFVGTIDFR